MGFGEATLPDADGHAEPGGGRHEPGADPLESPVREVEEPRDAEERPDSRADREERRGCLAPGRDDPHEPEDAAEGRHEAGLNLPGPSRWPAVPPAASAAKAATWARSVPSAVLSLR